MAAHRETAAHREAFERWYGLDRNYAKSAENYPATIKTLRSWGERFGWTELADRRDMEIARRVEKDAIARKTKLIEDQRKAGQILRSVGTRYFIGDDGKLKPGAISQAKDAIAAVEKGFALERQAEGLPDWVGQIINASDDEVDARFRDIESALNEGIPGAASREEEART